MIPVSYTHLNIGVIEEIFVSRVVGNAVAAPCSASQSHGNGISAVPAAGIGQTLWLIDDYLRYRSDGRQLVHVGRIISMDTAAVAFALIFQRGQHFLDGVVQVFCFLDPRYR